MTQYYDAWLPPREPIEWTRIEVVLVEGDEPVTCLRGDLPLTPRRLHDGTVNRRYMVIYCKVFSTMLYGLCWHTWLHPSSGVHRLNLRPFWISFWSQQQRNTRRGPHWVRDPFGGIDLKSAGDQCWTIDEINLTCPLSAPTLMAARLLVMGPRLCVPALRSIISNLSGS